MLMWHHRTSKRKFFTWGRLDILDIKLLRHLAQGCRRATIIELNLQQITIYFSSAVFSQSPLEIADDFNTSLLDSPLLDQVRFVPDKQGCSDSRHTGEHSFRLTKENLKNWNNDNDTKSMDVSSIREVRIRNPSGRCRDTRYSNWEWLLCHCD